MVPENMHMHILSRWYVYNDDIYTYHHDREIILRSYTLCGDRHVWSVHEFENIPLGTPLPSEPHFEKTHAIDMVDRPSEFSW